jgi:hypothetical protein
MTKPTFKEYLEMQEMALLDIEADISAEGATDELIAALEDFSWMVSMSMDEAGYEDYLREEYP